MQFPPCLTAKTKVDLTSLPQPTLCTVGRKWKKKRTCFFSHPAQQHQRGGPLLGARGAKTRSAHHSNHIPTIASLLTFHKTTMLLVYSLSVRRTLAGNCHFFLFLRRSRLAQLASSSDEVKKESSNLNSATASSVQECNKTEKTAP